VQLADLASKSDLLRHIRLQLSNLMEQVLADAARALNDKADTLLDGCQWLMRLLPHYRPIPKLEGIGAGCAACVLSDQIALNFMRLNPVVDNTVLRMVTVPMCNFSLSKIKLACSNIVCASTS
jgi:hypothetical protein